jgi:hypothetical protein
MPFDAMMSNPQAFFGTPVTSQPENPQEGEVYMDTNTNMLRMYVNGQWITPGIDNIPQLSPGETFDSAIKKHQTVIKELIGIITDLQLRVKELESIVGTENRFKNIVREIQDGEEDG